MKLKWRVGQWIFSCSVFRYTEVLAVVILNTVCVALIHDLLHAFIRTTVDCSHVAPNAAGHCPRGLMKVDGQCEPEHSRRWSGSSHCSSAAFVMNKAVLRSGNLDMAHLFGHFIAIFCVGPLIDLWGRKPVILMSILGDILRMALFIAASSMLTDGVMLLLLPAVFTSGATNAFHPAINAMVADVSKATVSGRANSYSTIKVTHTLATAAAFGIGFGVLDMQLTDYYHVWMAVTAVLGLLLVLAVLVLNETLPEDPLEGASSAEWRTLPGKGAAKEKKSKSVMCRRGWRMTKEVTRLLRKDRFLLNFAIVQFFRVAAIAISVHTLRPYAISHLGFTQQYASLAGMAVQAVSLVGIGGSRVMLRRFGPMLVYGGSLLGLATGFFIIGLSGFASSLHHSLCIFWTGLVIGALSLGFSETSGTVLLSLRVHQEAMGSVFSLEHGLGLAGHLVGVFLATHYLFNAAAKGWRRSACFTCCAFFVLLSAVWYYVAYCLLVARGDAADEPDSGSSASSDDESDDSKSVEE